MTQKEKFANWCMANKDVLQNPVAMAKIQSQIPGLEVKKVSSGALLVRFSPKDEWMDVSSWYQNYVSNCSLRLREEVSRLRNVCSPEQYAEVLGLCELVDNRDGYFVNGYDKSDEFLNIVKQFAGPNGVFTKPEVIKNWANFFIELERGTLGWSHKEHVYTGILKKKQ